MRFTRSKISKLPMKTTLRIVHSTLSPTQWVEKIEYNFNGINLNLHCAMADEHL